MVLRRETFHLAINLFDRYMSVKRDIRKEQLQLIGVTCLFIAGKLEVRLLWTVSSAGFPL